MARDGETARFNRHQRLGRRTRARRHDREEFNFSDFTAGAFICRRGVGPQGEAMGPSSLNVQCLQQSRRDDIPRMTLMAFRSRRGTSPLHGAFACQAWMIPQLLRCDQEEFLQVHADCRILGNIADSGARRFDRGVALLRIRD